MSELDHGNIDSVDEVAHRWDDESINLGTYLVVVLLGVGDEEVQRLLVSDEISIRSH